MVKFDFSLMLLAAVKISLAHCAFLLQGATIATWNETSQVVEVYPNTSLLIKGDTIVEVYKSGQTINKNDAQVINATGRFIVPGFVSTHHHVWQTLYKTLIPNLPFAAYFPRLGHMAPISSTLTPDEVYRSELMGALELMNEGTTTWVDITAVLSPDTVEAAWRATFASGGRSFFAATVQDRKNFTEDRQISQIKNLAIRPELRNSSLVTLGLSYDGFEAVTADSKSKLLDLVGSGHVKFISTHYVGGPFGNTNSPELLHRPEWNLLNSSFPVIFSHSSHLTPLDASLLRQTNQYISTAPESELHFGHGNPHAHLIQDQAALAADSVFGYSTSLINQARMWLQQVRGRLSALQIEQWKINTNMPMTVNQAFYLATRAGALALRRNDLGIIAKGAKADLVMYDTAGPNLLGWRDAVAAVILHSHSGDISDVMVGGAFVKRNNKLTFKDYDRFKREFKESALAFEKRYREYPFGETPHWFGLAKYEDAMTVDVVPGNATGY